MGASVPLTSRVDELAFLLWNLAHRHRFPQHSVSPDMATFASQAPPPSLPSVLPWAIATKSDSALNGSHISHTKCLLMFLNYNENIFRLLITYAPIYTYEGMESKLEQEHCK